MGETSGYRGEEMIAAIKKFLCRIGWHSIFVGFDNTEHDGASQHARCRWCGYEGMIDSQGNLF